MEYRLMNYASFLSWALKNLPKFKRVFELLVEMGALFSTEDVGTLGLVGPDRQAMTLDECPEPTEEEQKLEMQLAQALTDDGSMKQSAFDGSRLRKVFELLKALGPYIPAIIGLFGKTA